MSKLDYWVHYSSLDFAAVVYKTKAGALREDFFDRQFLYQYYGPFKTLKEARSFALEKVNSDLMEFKAMKESILNKPCDLTKRMSK